MCLVINKRVKLPKVQKDGYCIGYKVITNMNDSLYQWHCYYVGINISDRGSKALTQRETERGEVDKGFHIFLRLRTTKRAMFNRHFETRKVIKVFFKPEDVVALGTWDGDNTPHNVVVTKMFIKSLDGICKEK